MKNLLAAVAALLLAASGLGAQNQVRVADVRELIRAIGSDRTVLLAPGRYLLSEAAPAAGPAAAWRETFDGPELAITGVRNLTLRAPQGATLLASPRYAFSLVFENCQGLALEGLTIGHTEAGFCTGGVLSLHACSDVRIAGCDLFGSGTVGIDALDSSALTVRDSTIRDCTNAALWTERVRDLRLEKVTMSGNEAWPLLWIGNSRELVLDSCLIQRNSGDSLILVEDESGEASLSLPGTEIRGNQTDRLLAEGSLPVDFSGALIGENAFGQEGLADPEEYYEGEEGYEYSEEE